MSTKPLRFGGPGLSLYDKTTVKRDEFTRDPNWPWLVWCHCAFMPLAKAPDWLTAQLWAVNHAAEHEAQRCDKCGRLP
jgi:hypothetical protein